MEIDILEQRIYDMNPSLLKILLTDKTTKKFIRWACDDYQQYGAEYQADQEIHPNQIIGENTFIIQPRTEKSEEERARRTKEKAEVFTPSWVCNKQNNLIDEAWFGRPNVFNQVIGNYWKSNEDPIRFSDDENWKKYVNAKRLEITCGEAPYLVSRYDTVSGHAIPIKERIGLLDRKLRVVSENALSKEEWNYWAVRAFQSSYGFDYQGDNVLLARENLLLTFVEYYQGKIGKNPTLRELKKIANIVAWNIWQMNGITMTTPYSVAEPTYSQSSLFSDIELIEPEKEEMKSRIFDWRYKESLEFASLMKER